MLNTIPQDKTHSSRTRRLRSLKALTLCASSTLLLAAALPAAAQVAPTLVLTLSPPLGTFPVGTPVVLTATETSGGSPVTADTVEFVEVSLGGGGLGSLVAGTAQVNPAGVATLHITPGAGVHVYEAVSLPTNTLLPAVSASVSITGVPNGSYRTSDTVTATQLPLAGYSLKDVTTFYGTGTPTGLISFSNGGLPVGTPIPASTLTLTPGFAAPVTTPTGATVTSLNAVTGDFNNDGIADLATTNFSDNTLSILLGKGDGTFAAAKTYPTGKYPFAIAAGDFNGDGFQDLAVTNLLDNTISILLNDTTGGFLGQTTFIYKTGDLIAAAYSLVVGDFNKDGKLDLITTNLQTLDLSFLAGAGDGTFSAPTSAFTSGALVSPFTSVAADFDGDGIMDLALLDTNAPTAAKPSTTGSVYFLKGVGDGTFTLLKKEVVGSTPISLAVADFDLNGLPDVAVANGGSTGAAGLTTLLNQGAGVFKKQNTNTGAGPASIVVVDFNNDGYPDLAVANTTDTTISVFTNTKAAKPFTAPKSITVPTIGAPLQLLATDFNGDGRQDLAVIAFGGTSLGVQLGIQTATVTANAFVTAPASPASMYTSGLLDPYASSNSGMAGLLAKKARR